MRGSTAIDSWWSLGDFTRSLVNDPPKTLWTRELKVGDSLFAQRRAVEHHALTSLPLVCRCFEHINVVQEGNPHLHWYGYRRSLVYVYPVAALVSVSTKLMR